MRSEAADRGAGGGGSGSAGAQPLRIHFDFSALDDDGAAFDPTPWDGHTIELDATDCAATQPMHEAIMMRGWDYLFESTYADGNNCYWINSLCYGSRRTNSSPFNRCNYCECNMSYESSK